MYGGMKGRARGCVGTLLGKLCCQVGLTASLRQGKYGGQPSLHSTPPLLPLYPSAAIGRSNVEIKTVRAATLPLHYPDARPATHGLTVLHRHCTGVVITKPTSLLSLFLFVSLSLILSLFLFCPLSVFFTSLSVFLCCSCSL